MQTTIKDLLDVVHFAIIKNSGENNIILDELMAIDTKIAEGELENYPVDDTPFFKTIINSYIPK